MMKWRRIASIVEGVGSRMPEARLCLRAVGARPGRPAAKARAGRREALEVPARPRTDRRRSGSSDSSRSRWTRSLLRMGVPVSASSRRRRSREVPFGRTRRRRSRWGRVAESPCSSDLLRARARSRTRPSCTRQGRWETAACRRDGWETSRRPRLAACGRRLGSAATSSAAGRSSSPRSARDCPSSMGLRGASVRAGRGRPRSCRREVSTTSRALTRTGRTRGWKLPAA